jgi:predicted ribosome quality control (RQC) complex YloA/Tae2 family protein
MVELTHHSFVSILFDIYKKNDNFAHPIPKITHKAMSVTSETHAHTQTFVHDEVKYTIHSGKSAKGNDKLLDESSPSDVWFHVADAPSAHIILSNPTNLAINKIPRQVIKRCACICKASAKLSTKCAIIYTERANVEKTEILGRVTTTNVRTIQI